jgi:CBS domain-containing protein
MLERKIGCLPVVEDGRLVGILTESDFLRFAVEHAGPG